MKTKVLSLGLLVLSWWSILCVPAAGCPPPPPPPPPPPCCPDGCPDCEWCPDCSCKCYNVVVSCFYPDCTVCVGQEYEFTASGTDESCKSEIVWAAEGGDPPSLIGWDHFRTRWYAPGEKWVTATTPCSSDLKIVIVQNLCGTVGCCGRNRYCCGSSSEDPICCDANEVCCVGMGYKEGEGYYLYHYCNPPCWDEEVDSNTCAESQEEDYKCPGCTPLVGAMCGDNIYRDYTGLIQKECHDGCPDRHWNTETKPCYIVRECADVETLEDHVCYPCQDELICIPCNLSDCLCSEPSIPGCVLNVACALIGTCVKCGTGGTVVDPFTKETCKCKK